MMSKHHPTNWLLKKQTPQFLQCGSDVIRTQFLIQFIVTSSLYRLRDLHPHSFSGTWVWARRVCYFHQSGLVI